MRYAIDDVAASVEERQERVYRSGYGPEAVFDARSLGWFVVLQNTKLAINVGAEPPDIRQGDFVRLTLESAR